MHLSAFLILSFLCTSLALKADDLKNDTRQKCQSLKSKLEGIDELSETEFDEGLKRFDSLKKYCLSENTKSLFYQYQLKLSDRANRLSKYPTSISLSREALPYFKNKRDLKEIITAESILASNFLFTGNQDSSELICYSYFNKIDSIDMEDQLKYRYKFHTTMGIRFGMGHKIEEAISHFKSADSLALMAGNKTWQGNVAGFMGNIYSLSDQEHKAEEYFKKAIELCVSEEDFGGAMAACDNLANTYRALDMPQEALQVLGQCYNYAIKSGDSVGLATNFAILSSVYQDMQDFEKATYWVKEAKKIQERMNNVYGILQTHERLIKIYELTGQFEKMHESSKTLLGLSMKYKSVPFRIHAYRGLWTSSDSLGNLSDAYDYAKWYYWLTDSTTKANFNERTALLQAQFNDANQKNEILNLKNEKQQVETREQRKKIINRLLLAFSIVLILILIVLIWLTRSLRKSKIQTEIQKAEVEKNDREKAVLLKELHHRVKNNLQIVSSLLNLQGDAVKDVNAQIAFKEGQNRVDAMAMIHKHLYTSDELTSIDIKGYLERLIQSLAFSYGYNKNDISINMSIFSDPIDVDVAIPLGLIINELASNSFKHAFNNTDDPEFQLTLSLIDGIINIEIRDNGPGLADNIMENRSSFGLELVHTLIHQLNGNIEFANQNGAHITIRLNASKMLPINPDRK